MCGTFGAKGTIDFFLILTDSGIMLWRQIKVRSGTYCCLATTNTKVLLRTLTKVLESMIGTRLR